MQAYNGLNEESDPCLKQVSSSGTEVTYVDRNFIKSKLSGILKVTVKSASSLPAADWWPGSSDPYVSLSLAGSSARTTTIPKNLNPEWNETFYLFTHSPTDRLSIKVLDEDVGAADDLLGVTMRGIADVLDTSSPVDVELDLRNPKGVNGGKLKLSLEYVSFSDDGVVEDTTGSMGGSVIGSLAAEFSTSPWQSLKEELIPAEAAADALFDPVAFVDSPVTDTQAWLFWNPELKKACIAFRGTEQTKWKDVLTDLTLTPASLDPENVSEGPSAADLLAPTAKALQVLQQGLGKGDAGSPKDLRALLSEAVQAAGRQEEDGALWVHSGFLKAYKSIEVEVLGLLETMLAGEKDAWTVYITGHSLGGALATMCAFDCAKRRSWKALRPEIVVYTYGSPRVGNKVFAKEFDSLLPNTWRVTNKNDAVTFVPRLLGYSHVGHKVSLGPGGEAEVEWQSSQGLGEGAAFTEVAASMVASTIAGDAAGVVEAAAVAGVSAQDVQMLIEQEVTAMNCLLDGSGLEEHLEPLYMENLKEAMVALAKRSRG